MGRREEYNWLDDPFDEKKAAAEREQAHMSGGSRAAVGCGCALAVLAAIAFLAALLGVLGAVV